MHYYTYATQYTDQFVTIKQHVSCMVLQVSQITPKKESAYTTVTVLLLCA